jgi:hypothetical protein
LLVGSDHAAGIYFQEKKFVNTGDDLVKGVKENE